MSQAGVQIGLTGKAFAKGIPDATLTWTDPAGTSHSVTIHNSFRKQPFSQVSESTGNRGEWLAERRRNRGYRITVESKPIGAKESDARAIAAGLPLEGSLAAITGATDTSINTVSALSPDYIVESAETNYTPENDTVISMTLKVLLADDGTTHIVPVALADS